MTSTVLTSDSDRLLQVDGLLARVEAGDQQAFGAVISILHDELRAIAHHHRLRWRGDETLGTTALVNEAYLKLADGSATHYGGHPHLLAVASRAMRQILVDYARSKQRAKRGGRAEHVPLASIEDIRGELTEMSAEAEDAVLALNESLDRLKAHSERHARIVECRFFGGLSIEETAAALDVAPATVKRGWTVAQAWLRRDLSEPYRCERTSRARCPRA